MLGLILWLAAAPLAEDPAFKEGVRLYEQVDLDAAIVKFGAALATATTDADRATAQTWIALSHAQLGRREEATVAFRAAVRLDPAVKLPALAPPDVEAMLEAARAELKPAPVSTPPPTTTTAPVTTTVPPAETPPTEAPPTSTEPAPSAPSEDGMPTGAIVAGTVGVALLVAGAATFGVGLDTVLRQSVDPANFNDDARALRETGYLEYAVAGGLAGVGAAALGAGVFLAVSE